MSTELIANKVLKLHLNYSQKLEN